MGRHYGRAVFAQAHYQAALPHQRWIMPLPQTPALTSDCVIFDGKRRLLLIRRKNPPFKGMYALPGGFVDIGEAVPDACRREVFEETGLKAGELYLVGVYSDPARDPRGHTSSVVYLTEMHGADPKAGDDAEDAIWADSWDDLPIAFDHRKIIADAISVREALKSGALPSPYCA
jgi:8-oxo-dGTP diphosphatase